MIRQTTGHHAFGAASFRSRGWLDQQAADNWISPEQLVARLGDRRHPCDPCEQEPIRTALVRQVREQIHSGTYLTNQKLGIAIERLSRELFEE